MNIINQELKTMGDVVQVPELSRLLNKLESLNVEINDLSNEISYRLNSIKQIPIQGLSKSEQIVPQPIDVLSHLENELSNLENNKVRLQSIFTHIQTII